MHYFSCLSDIFSSQGVLGNSRFAVSVGINGSVLLLHQKKKYCGKKTRCFHKPNSVANAWQRSGTLVLMVTCNRHLIFGMVVCRFGSHWQLKQSIVYICGCGVMGVNTNSSFVTAPCYSMSDSLATKPSTTIHPFLYTYSKSFYFLHWFWMLKLDVKCMVQNHPVGMS